jgi:hypothetical protein
MQYIEYRNTYKKVNNHSITWGNTGDNQWILYVLTHTFFHGVLSVVLRYERRYLFQFKQKGGFLLPKNRFQSGTLPVPTEHCVRVRRYPVRFLSVNEILSAANMADTLQLQTLPTLEYPKSPSPCLDPACRYCATELLYLAK